MSEHLHSHAEPHSCSLSEHSLQFELRSTAPSFPFLFPSTPNHHVPAPTLNLSSNPPLFCGSLPKVHPPPPPPPSFPPPQLLVPDPPTRLCPRQLFYTPLSTFLAKTWESVASEFCDSSCVSRPCFVLFFWKTWSIYCHFLTRSPCFRSLLQPDHTTSAFAILWNVHPRSVNTVGNVSF